MSYYISNEMIEPFQKVIASDAIVWAILLNAINNYNNFTFTSDQYTSEVEKLRRYHEQLDHEFIYALHSDLAQIFIDGLIENVQHLCFQAKLGSSGPDP